MNNFFDVNGSFYNGLYRVYEMVVLTVLFFLTSLPLVTIGASLTSVYVSWFKITNGHFNGKLTSTYFTAFRDNFRKATIVWTEIMAVLATALLAWPIWAAIIHVFSLTFYLFILILTVFMLTLTYVFPLLARFENPISKTLKNAYLLSMANIAYSIIILVLSVAIMAALPIFSLLRMPGILFLWLFTGLGLSTYLNTLIFNHVFKKYIEKADNHEDKTE